MRRVLIVLAGALAIGAARVPDPEPAYDVLIVNGLVYDGAGGAPYRGEVAIRGDRIAFTGVHAPERTAARTLDAHGLAIAPGFVNMLAHPEASLMADGRALSDLTQGVTLEVMGEDSMAPITDKVATLEAARQGDIRFPVDWRNLDQYFHRMEAHGIGPNIATFVGAGTVRTDVLGEGDVQPTPAQLDEMRGLVRQAMQDGALGLTTALIYSPNEYARTPELIALAKESADCGGIYIAHMRSEGDRLLEAVDEEVQIARASGAPAEIYHLKESGQSNWDKLDPLIAKVEAARASGTRITADMYTYTAGATGLDAAMPPWVQDGGLEAWIARLKDPAIRARVIAEMRSRPKDWENLYWHAGPERTLLLAFKTDRLKPLTGKTLAEAAKLRGESPEDTAIDLVIEDGTRIEVAYFLMSEDNVRRQMALPWVGFGSDEAAPAPEGVFLKANNHPRAYGNFARIFAKYVREDHALSVQEAVRKLTTLPADNLSLPDRGRLKAGAFADVVVFDPATFQDHATYDKPHQLSTGVQDVIVNGRFALADGKPTGALPGRAVRSRSWTGAPGGGCRKSPTDWTWHG
ncbi:MAG TPA: amidohydrolase family protein [Caulobacteraceae bacterium]|jgi:N-acyl-D-amino-acid deacylase|nr:amidohydrolase family protein [Caulobacteraceae bacterium]